MEELIELAAPGGCDEASHDTRRWRVDNDGRVRVPREAAHALIKYAGFRPVPLPEPEIPNAPAPAASPAFGEAEGNPLARVGPPRPKRSVK
jgi:hypothetical protein